MAKKTNYPPLPEPTDIADFDARLAATPGAVLLDFAQTDCEACEPDERKLQKILATCANPSALVLKVDCDKFPDLADRYGIEDTPTLIFAKSVAELNEAGAAKKIYDLEVYAADARRLIKCARMRRS